MALKSLKAKNHAHQVFGKMLKRRRRPKRCCFGILPAGMSVGAGVNRSNQVGPVRTSLARFDVWREKLKQFLKISKKSAKKFGKTQKIQKKLENLKV